MSCQTPLDVGRNIKKTPLDTLKLIPFSEDYIWVYTHVFFNQSGAEQGVLYDTVSFNQVDLNDEAWFLQTGTLENDSTYFKESPEGVYSIIDDSVYLALKFPSTTGIEYDVPYHSENNPDTLYLKRAIKATDERIEVKEGSYNCYKYWDILQNTKDEIFFDPLFISYYSPGKGLILRLNYQISNQGEVYVFKRIELKEILEN